MALCHSHSPTTSTFPSPFPHLPSPAELTPYLHALLLLRDGLREELGLPGGLHEPARPHAYDALPDDLRCLWTYRRSAAAAGGSGGAVTGLLLPPPQQQLDCLGPQQQHPLVVAASRGNVDAVQLLLLFGEGVAAGGGTSALAPPPAPPQLQQQQPPPPPASVAAGRRRAHERALYAAAEQGNVAVVAALLGRAPLRPPAHSPHLARRLGLLRPVWDVYGPAPATYVYASGVATGPLDPAAAIAAAKGSADRLAATGMSGGGGVASATSSSGPRASLVRAGGGALTAVSPAEVLVAQQAHWEADGRYRTWARGYRTGTYWSLYDTSLAANDVLHGPLGHGLTSGDVGGGSGGGGGRESRPSSAAAALRPSLAATGGRGAAAASMHLRAAAASGFDGDALAQLLQGYASPCYHDLRTSLRLAPGSYSAIVAAVQRREGGGRRTFAASPYQELLAGSSSTSNITPAPYAQALLTTSLPPTAPLAAVARTRPRGHLHLALPPPLDYGRVAADALAVTVRLNGGGPCEGRTPLHAAAERCVSVVGGGTAGNGGGGLEDD